MYRTVNGYRVLHPTRSEHAKDFSRLLLLGNDYDYGLNELSGREDDDAACCVIDLPKGWWISVNGDIGPAVGTKATLHRGEPSGECMMPVAVGPCRVDLNRLEALVALFEAVEHFSGDGEKAVRHLLVELLSALSQDLYDRPPLYVQDWLTGDGEWDGPYDDEPEGGAA